MFKLLSLKQKFAVGGVAAACIAVAFGLGHWTGSVRGGAGAQIICAENKVKELTEGKKDNEKKLRKNSGLDDDALDREWCRWVLDTPFDECLRRNKSVRP